MWNKGLGPNVVDGTHFKKFEKQGTLSNAIAFVVGTFVGRGNGKDKTGMNR
jgi:hypothetical protein